MPATPWLAPGTLLDSDTDPFQGVQLEEVGGHSGVYTNGVSSYFPDHLVGEGSLTAGEYSYFNDAGAEDPHFTLVGFNFLDSGTEGETFIPPYSTITGIEVRVLASSTINGADYHGPLESPVFRVGIMPYANTDATPTQGTNPAGNINVYKWKYATGPYTSRGDWNPSSLPRNSMTDEDFTPMTHRHNPRHEDMQVGYISSMLQHNIWIKRNIRPQGKGSGDNWVGPGFYNEDWETMDPVPYYFGGPNSTWGLTFPVIPSENRDQYMWGTDSTLAVRIELVSDNERINTSIRDALRFHQVAIKVHYVENGIGHEMNTFNLIDDQDKIKSGVASTSASWLGSSQNMGDGTFQGAESGAIINGGGPYTAPSWNANSQWYNLAWWNMSGGVNSNFSYDFPALPNYAVSTGYRAVIGHRLVHYPLIPSMYTQYGNNGMCRNASTDTSTTCPEHTASPIATRLGLFPIEIKVKDIIQSFNSADPEVPSELISITLDFNVCVNYRKSNSTYARDASMGFYIYLGGWDNSEGPQGSFETGTGEASPEEAWPKAYSIPKDVHDTYLNPFSKINTSSNGGYFSNNDIAPFMGGPYYLSGSGIDIEDPIQEEGTGGPGNVTKINHNWWNEDDNESEFGGDATNVRYHKLKIDINGPLLEAVRYRAIHNPHGNIRLVLRDIRSLQGMWSSGNGMYPSPDRPLDFHDNNQNLSAIPAYQVSYEGIAIQMDTSSVTIRTTKKDVSRQTKKIMGFYDRLADGPQPAFGEVLDVNADQMEVMDCKTHGSGYALLSQYDFFRFIGTGEDTGGWDLNEGGWYGNQNYVSFKNSYLMSPWDEDHQSFTNQDFAGSRVDAIVEYPNDWTCFPTAEPNRSTSGGVSNRNISWYGCNGDDMFDDTTGFNVGFQVAYRAQNWSGANFDGSGHWTSGMGNNYSVMKWNPYNEDVYDSLSEYHGMTSGSRDCIREQLVMYNDLGRWQNSLYPLQMGYSGSQPQHEWGNGGGSPRPVGWEDFRTAPEWHNFSIDTGDYAPREPENWIAPTGWVLQGVGAFDTYYQLYHDYLNPNVASLNRCKDASQNMNTSNSARTGPSKHLEVPGGPNARYIYLESSGTSTSGFDQATDNLWGNAHTNYHNSIIQSPNIDVSNVDPDTLFFEFFSYQYTAAEEMGMTNNTATDAAVENQPYDVGLGIGSVGPQSLNELGIGRTFIDVIRMDPATSTHGRNDGTIHPDPDGVGTYECNGPEECTSYNNQAGCEVAGCSWDLVEGGVAAKWKPARLDLYWDPGTCWINNFPYSITQYPQLTEKGCCALISGTYTNPTNPNSFVGGSCATGVGWEYTAGPIDPTGTPHTCKGRSLGFSEHTTYDDLTPGGAIEYHIGRNCTTENCTGEDEGKMYPVGPKPGATLSQVNYGRIQNGYYRDDADKGCHHDDPLCQWARVRAALSEFVNPDINSRDNIIRIQLRHLSCPYRTHADVDGTWRENTEESGHLYIAGPRTGSLSYKTDVFATKFSLIGDKWDIPFGENAEVFSFAGNLPPSKPKDEEEAEEGANE